MGLPVRLSPARARRSVGHAFFRMRNHKILRACRQRGDGLHHAGQVVAHMHDLALAARADRPTAPFRLRDHGLPQHPSVGFGHSSHQGTQDAEAFRP